MMVFDKKLGRFVDRDGVLKDGQSVRVRLDLMDNAPAPRAARERALLDQINATNRSFWAK